MTEFLGNTDNFFLWIGDQPGREKVTIGLGEKGVHYTIVFKESKQLFDLHKTIELPNGEKKYEPISEMKPFTLVRILASLHGSQAYLLQKFWLANRINLGKLGHHDLMLFPLEVSEEDATHLIDNKRKRQIKLKKQIPIEPFKKLFIHPHEIATCPYRSFWVYSSKRGNLGLQGFIFQLTGDKRTHSFYFVSRKQLNAFIRANHLEILKILSSLQFVNKQVILAELSNHFGVPMKSA